MNNTMKNKSQKLGFTLVELLVVIAIIGILASLGFYGFSTAQKATRDTQRKNDLNQYRIALENYANANNGVYPVYTLATNASTVCSGPLSSYLSSCPEDVLSGSGSHYSYQSSSGIEYTLWADLENGGFWVVYSTGESKEEGTIPTPTPTPTSTPSPTPSPSATPTRAPSPTPTLTLSPTATPTPGPTATPAPTSTPTPYSWSACFTENTTTNCDTVCGNLGKTATTSCVLTSNPFCCCFYSDTSCSTWVACTNLCNQTIGMVVGAQGMKCCCQ